MNIVQKLTQRQSQTLSMTRQLQQAIQLLELSNLDLAQYVEQALLENPVLEALHMVPEESKAVEAEEVPPHYDHENLWSSRSSAGTSSQKLGSQDSFDPFYKACGPEKTLREVIEEQIRRKIKDPVQRIIAFNLLGYLDSSGYLGADYIELEDVLQCQRSDLESVIQTLRSFEPMGVFARTLAECLEPQLQAKGLLSKAVRIVLANLQNFADGQITTILKTHDLTQQEFAEAMLHVQAQNPKPGLIYDDGNAQTNLVVPDAYLENTDQGWVVTLNEHSLPRVLINKGYVQTLSRNIRSPNDKKHLSHYVQDAHFIINALAQRADTLIRVCTEIAKQQVQFFQYGIRYFKPITLREVAEKLDLHESTISRVTNNKYIQTPRGTFELKHFFSSRITAVSGKSSVSSRSIKHRIKELIRQETERDPLSDEDLVEILKEEGIQVARRTVAKYREAENIPSLYVRKKQYKIKNIFG